MSMDEFTKHFPATGTAGGPGSGGCSQPSCGNCEELTARVALLEEERKIIVRERDEALAALREARNDSDEWQSLHAALFAEAETLRQERDEAREALREICALVQRFGAWENHNDISGSCVAIEDICDGVLQKEAAK